MNNDANHLEQKGGNSLVGTIGTILTLGLYSGKDD